MPSLVVVGSQWGDEGKAKVVDLLSADADLIVRYQGGSNAGHTVTVDDVKYKFQLIPSRILYKGKKCFVVDTQRDFIEMEDFLDLFDRIMQDDAPTGTYNVSSGSDVTIKEIFDSIVENLGIKLDEPVEVRPPEDDDVARILLDPSETEKAFGWKATTSLKEGMVKQIQWFKENGVEQTYSHLKIAQKNKD